jgi:hypothetical protein
MNKNILIKLSILLIVLALVYSVFWFLRVGQIEKKIKSFISKNGSYISAGEVSVSGFPLLQKIIVKDVKFNIAHPLLNKYQIAITQLEAKAGIFSSNFSVTLPQQLSLKDVKSKDSTNELLALQFNQKPEITVLIVNSNSIKSSYRDFGYKILDSDKNVIVYGAESSSIKIESNFSDDDKIVNKIIANIEGIENFSVIDIYKNILEKRVLEGIRTGEIVVGNAAPAAISNQTASSPATSTPATSTPALAQVASGNNTSDNNVSQLASKTQNSSDAAKSASNSNPAVTEHAQDSFPASNNNNSVKESAAQDAASKPQVKAASKMTADNPVKPDSKKTPEKTPSNQEPKTAANKNAGDNLPVPVAEIVKPQEIINLAAKNDLVKSSLVIDAEYTLVPNQSEQQNQIPSDPTQIQETPLQYRKIVKANNVEFANSLYKISINGEMNTLTDDNMPSGSITVKVEKIDNLISQINDEFKQMIEIEQAKPANAEMDSGETSSINTASVKAAYCDFMTRIVNNLGPVSKELAAKNAVSKEEIAEFDLRREKNIEFLINETPVREILGKF